MANAYLVGIYNKIIDQEKLQKYAVDALPAMMANGGKKALARSIRRYFINQYYRNIMFKAIYIILISLFGLTIISCSSDDTAAYQAKITDADLVALKAKPWTDEMTFVETETKEALEAYSKINEKIKSLNSKIKGLEEEIEAQSRRSKKSEKIIKNYTRQINYAEKELISNSFANDCNTGDSEFTNIDMNLDSEYNSKIVKFNFKDKYTKSDLMLRGLRYGSSSDAGIAEIIKFESGVGIKIYSRKNDNILDVYLIGKFEDSSGSCEAKIHLIFAPEKTILKVQEDKVDSSAILKTNLSPELIMKMKSIEWRYSSGLEDQLEIEIKLLENSKKLLENLNTLAMNLTNNSEIISRLSRSIYYAKKIIEKPQDISNCFQNNLHLRNKDFGYPDLFQEGIFSLEVGKEYTEKNLSLISLKIKELKHAGIADLIYDENLDSTQYHLKLFDQNNIMESIELRAVFKRKNGEYCSSNIRTSFFPVHVDLGFLSKYESISVLGKIGDDSEEFQLPYGSAFYQDALFITDCVNAKIQVFDKAGRFLYNFGERGASSGQIYRTPADVQVYDDKVFIAEGGNHRIEQFSLSGEYQKGWGSFGDASKNQSRYAGKFNKPFGIDFIDNMMIVSEHLNYRVQALDLTTGKTRWISSNSDGDVFDWMEPYYLKADPTRNLMYVVGRTRNWVGVLDLKGEKQYTFGNGVLNYPHELDVGVDGKIYIADSKNYRLVIYNNPDDEEYETLQFSSSWGYLKTVAVDKDGSLALGLKSASSAFVLLLSTNKSSEKKPGQAVLEAQKEAIIKNSIKNDITFDQPSWMRTENLYTKNCAGCHEEGSFDAPVRGNRESWHRFPRSPTKLLELAFEGNGAMQPKGGCDECTSEDLSALIKYMAPMDWLGKR